MLQNIIQKVFDVREGEFKVSLWMLSYIFLIIAVLLIIKPTVNALFLSELGVEQLPFAFLVVALTAVVSSFFYYRALIRFSLHKIIEATLLGSVVILFGFGILLKLNMVGGFLLYFFYVFVAIYAVLSASQFWVLANLVYNIREAKRLFGFIGSGAIMGGIFGGYLTSILAPLIGNDHMILVAALVLLFCIPLLHKIWRSRVSALGKFKEKKRTVSGSQRPLFLILKSRHLSYIAGMVALSVLVAKLVDYLFSDFAAAAIPDVEDLAAFFAFWFSTFNLLSLAIQLFFTHRIVGIWGVGYALLLLPTGIILGCTLFLFIPELAAVIVIKAMDGVMKQSVHKSATELLTLPLPFDLKNKTKSFIDVVVDSIATGIAGCLLIFVIQGLELPSVYITGLIVLLVGAWVALILQGRKEYYKSFRRNLEQIAEREMPAGKGIIRKSSVVDGMRTVFRNGTEEQILFMLGKLMEINDKRFEEDVQLLLGHPSNQVRTAAIRNLYFLNRSSMITGINELLNSGDEALTLATLEYLLLHAGVNSSVVYNRYLNHPSRKIAEVALYCLAREARDNDSLRSSYNLHQRIQDKLQEISESEEEIPSLKLLLKTIGAANIPEFYPVIASNFGHFDPGVVKTAIEAAGKSVHPEFINALLHFLPAKVHRPTVTASLHRYGARILSHLVQLAVGREIPTAICRLIPGVLKGFHTQEAVRELFQLLDDPDLGVRLETVRALGELRRINPELKFNRYKVAAAIFEECRLHHLTLSAMHTQIIISYRNRKKPHMGISQEEREARTSLLELLERRLDSGLERIFTLLTLKYYQPDVEIAYEGLLSEKQEIRINAIEFLDNLLTGDLKRTLLPIIEESALDISSEEVLLKIKHKVPSEAACFEMLLQSNDLKVKLAVLYLIRQQKNGNYLPMILPFTESEDLKLRTFANEAVKALGAVSSAS